MNESPDTLDALLDNPAIWRAGEPATSAGPDCISSDHPALDAVLPGGGWPRGALTEVLYDHGGIGELRLLMPALARLSHQGGWIALVAPPHIPYAPALRQYGIDLSRVLLVHPRSGTDSLWAVEQALRTGTCGAVLAWPKQIDDRSLRRLQLAAEAGDTLGVLFRETSAAEQPSPAALRLRLSRDEPGRDAQARILKCRGGTRREHLSLELDAAPGSTASDEAERATPSAGPNEARPSRRPGQPRRNRGPQRRAAQMDLPLAGGTTPAGSESATPDRRH